MIVANDSTLFISIFLSLLREIFYGFDEANSGYVFEII